MESPDHYNGKLLADEDFMKDFDYEMSYRARAHVPWLYSEPYLNGVFNTPHRLWDPPVPFSEKLNAVAYLNSNCHTPSGRAEAMEALIQMNVYPVHAFGRCSHNKDLSPDFKSKVAGAMGCMSSDRTGLLPSRWSCSPSTSSASP